MDLIIVIILAIIFSFFDTGKSSNNNKSDGSLSDYEKFDMFNRFNKK